VVSRAAGRRHTNRSPVDLCIPLPAGMPDVIECFLYIQAAPCFGDVCCSMRFPNGELGSSERCLRR
jgi:hypothetical protein